MHAPFQFACPRCRGELEPASDGQSLRCPLDDLLFPCQGGVWRFLLPERQDYFARFISEYERVRRAEGRGSPDPAFYRALPEADLSGQRPGDWRIRRASYHALLTGLVQPLEGARPLRILDLGAGNAWLSNRLAGRGHALAAVDLLANDWDGLGAHIHYPTRFICAQAEFERLPFAAGQADLVIFNASFHYAVDYQAVLAEALRLLRSGGLAAVMDSPLYTDESSGEQMVRERQESFTRQYGFPSDALPSREFLTLEGVEALAEALDLRWRMIHPAYGWRWALRPWLARLRRQRQPASFALLIFER